jgi:hypothetical protein
VKVLASCERAGRAAATGFGGELAPLAVAPVYGLASKDLVVGMTYGDSCEDCAGFRAELGWSHIKNSSGVADPSPAG